MKKYLFCILTFVVFLTSCNNNSVQSPTSKHTNEVIPILYYEYGNLKSHKTSTSILKSGKLENYEDYIRGAHPRAVPISKINKAEVEYSLSKDKWRLEDYLNYKSNEIYIFRHNTLSEYCIINNGEKHILPLYGGYRGVQLEDNSLCFLEIYGEDYTNISIRRLDLSTGQSTLEKTDLDKKVEEDIEDLYLHNNELYFIEYDMVTEKQFLSRYNIETKKLDHYKPDYWLDNFFLLDDKVVLVGATPEFHLVVDTLDYDLLLQKTEIHIPPNGNGAIHYVVNTEMIMLNNTIYGTLGDDNGIMSFFGFNILTNEWTDLASLDKPNLKDNHLMAVMLNYVGENGELFHLPPHVNNVK